MSGTLYLVATPIGNLEDMSFRAVRILKEADLIAAEDTRDSLRLLRHFEIDTPMTSYHEYNKYEKARKLVEKLQAGKHIAVITDAGTPGISDPGEELVKMALAAGIAVTPVPGAAAVIAALVASGQKTRRFCFEGFLPSDKKERRAVLASLSDETRTIVLYEAPHHLVKTLEQLKETLSGTRSLTICRELTKKHEEFWQTTIDGALARYETQEPRGEYVLVLAGKDPAAVRREAAKQWESLSVAAHMEQYLAQGIDKKEAMKRVAKDRGIGRRDVYQALLAQEKQEDETNGSK